VPSLLPPPPATVAAAPKESMREGDRHESSDQMPPKKTREIKSLLRLPHQRIPRPAAQREHTTELHATLLALLVKRGDVGIGLPVASKAAGGRRCSIQRQCLHT
jgi:hypothetical protein